MTEEKVIWCGRDATKLDVHVVNMKELPLNVPADLTEPISEQGTSLYQLYFGANEFSRLNHVLSHPTMTHARHLQTKPLHWKENENPEEVHEQVIFQCCLMTIPAASTSQVDSVARFCNS